MRTTFLAFTVGLVRAWTRVYTWNLDPAFRDQRRAEIDSDLWEQVHAPDAGSMMALQILGRLVLGMPADLQWRLERGWPVVSPRLVMLAMIGTALVVLTVVVVTMGRPRVRPPIPQAPMIVIRGVALDPPPPPPPPPPLCGPDTPRGAKCTRWP